MDTKTYIIVSGIIFGIVAIGHGFRLATELVVKLGEWNIPMIASWGGMLIALTLSAWSIMLLRKKD